MQDIAIACRDLGKRYRSRQDMSRPTLWHSVRRAVRFIAPSGNDTGAFWALQGVTFELARGERLGIIGSNGAGKSTLLKILARIAYPTVGEARIRGRVTSLLEVGTGFNPNLSGRENVYLNAFLHGLTRPEVDARFNEIVSFSGVEDFLDLPVRHYSSGMFLRLAFSVAAHLDPDVVLLDEVLAVGDLSFQQKCLRRMETLGSEGRTVVFVSHSIDAIVRFCTRCIWLDHGHVVQDGPAADVTQAYLEQALSVRARQAWTCDSSGSALDADAGTLPSPTAGTVATAATVPPCNEFVRLVAARVVDIERRTVSGVRTDEPVGIEVVYDILKEGKNIQPAVHFRTAHDTLAFVAAYTDPERMHAQLPVGRYAATVWLPPHLLNTGLLYVTVQMVTPDPLERHCGIDRGLAFHVTDPIDLVEGSARGLYGRDFPGVVRPLLEWDTVSVSPNAETTVPLASGYPAPLPPR
jgi:lipopolysaccharide transport system ATP-binding protein